MLKALIPVELNLASNIALRYACQKAALLDMGLQPIHVEEPDGKSHSAQSGWIRRTWEAGLEEAGREEVERILHSEQLDDCVVMPQPIVAVGDREDEILEELRRGRYDLYIEGAVSNFNLGTFRQLLRSKLYKHMPCPVLLVKNLIASDRVVLLLGQTTDPVQAAKALASFIKPETVFDLCVHVTDDYTGDPDALLTAARQELSAQGRMPDNAQVMRGQPEAVAEKFREYGLLVSTLNRSSSRKSALTDIFGRVSCPLLLCW
ncbi:universal stress protein [Desulfovibrio inopinatus]|uniref:universal stress protein n=1 Tax=Desulfovibrio inopinatus TaxID=102109 RepID=UPI00042A0825|nr:universal stress protein [Desulfovibrio inopinatus]